MPIEITMPRLSDTMEEGTLIKWHVKVGDKISSGDILADIETDKATMEMQSYDDGTVAELSLAESQTAPVGRLILVLTELGEKIEAAVVQAEATPRPAASAQTPAPAAPPPKLPRSDGATRSSGRLRISPVARKLVEENGLDAAAITGSGPDGRIVKRDVLAALDTAKPTAQAPLAPVAAPIEAPAARPQTQTVPISSMRRTIARRLVESKTTIPHFTVTVAVDMDALTAMREMLNGQLESQGVKLSVNDFIVRGAALALMDHPTVNASWTDAGIEMYGAAHIGVAVALPTAPDGSGGGLVVPVIRDAQQKGLRQINAETRDLATAARQGGLSSRDMSGGTFTISNLGMFGVEHFEAIINPPEAAILAVGAAQKKPVVREGRIVIGHEMTCTISADHRVVDGAIAAAFLNTLKGLLENPAVMMV